MNIHWLVWTHREEADLKHNAYNEIYFDQFNCLLWWTILFLLNYTGLQVSRKNKRYTSISEISSKLPSQIIKGSLQKSSSIQIGTFFDFPCGIFIWREHWRSWSPEGGSRWSERRTLYQESSSTYHAFALQYSRSYLSSHSNLFRTGLCLIISLDRDCFKTCTCW